MLKKATPPQRRIWPLVMIMVLIGVLLGAASLAFMRAQVRPINGNVPDFAQRRIVAIVEVSPTRFVETAVTITLSVDSEMVGPFPYLALDANGDGKPDNWERLIITPNLSPFVYLSVSQLTRGRIACRLIDADTGEQLDFNSRPDAGAVRCYHNRPVTR